MLRLRARRGVAGNAVQPPNTDRRIDSLELEFSDRLADAPAAERPKHAIGEQCLARGRGGDESRREVHGVAQHRIVMPVRATNRSGHDFAAGDSDVRLKGVSGILVRSSQGLMDIEGGPRGAQWIVVMGARGAKQRHDRVADMLVDRAVIADDDAVDQRREARHELMNLFGVQGS